MKLLLKNVLVRGESGATQTQDIEVTDGIITQMGEVEGNPNHKIIRIDNLECSVGFFDPFVNFCEPGLEYKEDFISGINTASFGGFTQVGLTPDTEPSIDNRPQLDFVKASTANRPTTVSVFPSFVKSTNHNELSEIVELSDAGAIGFLQPTEHVIKPSVILKALDYAKITGKKIVVYVTDFDIVPGAFIHEGDANVKIGMRGIPDFSEEILVKEYVELLRYTKSAMHISGISSAKSLKYLQEAKNDGLELTSDTSIYNLIFTDKELINFDTNFKLNPPLRSENDRLALIEAVKSGVIDCVTSKHAPQDEDVKKSELKMASFGVVGLQTMFSALTKVFSIEETINILTTRNRAAFNVGVPKLATGEKANIALFIPGSEWSFNASSNKSKSDNSMFFNSSLKGKPMGVIHGQYSVLNSDD